MNPRPPPPAEQPLDALLPEIAAGDQGAFADFYRRTSPQLFGFVLRILRRRDKAEEVVQDTYLRVWRRAGDWRPDYGSAMTWVASIAHHRAVDVLRRDGRLVPLDPDAPEPPDPSPAADPLALAIAGDEALRLKHCLESLEPKPREAIVTAYFEGLTHEELAARMAAPLGTVKSWIRRGLVRLKECLEP